MQKKTKRWQLILSRNQSDGADFLQSPLESGWVEGNTQHHDVHQPMGAPSNLEPTFDSGTLDNHVCEAKLTHESCSFPSPNSSHVDFAQALDDNEGKPGRSWLSIRPPKPLFD